MASSLTDSDNCPRLGEGQLSSSSLNQENNMSDNYSLYVQAKVALNLINQLMDRAESEDSNFKYDISSAQYALLRVVNTYEEVVARDRNEIKEMTLREVK
jgi:hypothetical protein